MKRKQAERLIDDIRVIAASASLHPEHEADMARHMRALIAVLDQHHLPSLEQCDGESHSKAFIDNCMRCAPRWGWVGKVEKVT